MVSLYYALPKEKESDCQKFKLSVQLIPGQINHIHFPLDRRVKYEKDDIFPAEAFHLELQPSLDWSRTFFKIKFCGPAVSVCRRGRGGLTPDFFITAHLCVTNKLKPYHPASFLFAFYICLSNKDFGQKINRQKGQRNVLVPTEKRDEDERVYKLRIDVL